MKLLITLCSLVLLSGCAGIIPLPPTGGEIGLQEEDVQIGVVTKEDLGEPLIHTSDHRFYLYSKVTTGAQKTIFADFIPHTQTSVWSSAHRILVEFDENGTAKRVIQNACDDGAFVFSTKKELLCRVDDSNDLLYLLRDNYGNDLADHYKSTDNLPEWDHEQLWKGCFTEETCNVGMTACLETQRVFNKRRCKWINLHSYYTRLKQPK